MATLTAKRDRRDQFVWGWLRLVLGFSQMALVALTFGVLITAGVTTLTMVLTAVATCVAVASRLLYRGRKGPRSQ